MLLNIKVTPRASTNIIVGLKNDALHIKVTAVPENNEANESVIKLISDFFGIAKSKVQVISGTKSRHKTILIDTINKDQIIEKLLAIPKG